MFSPSGYCSILHIELLVLLKCTVLAGRFVGFFVFFFACWSFLSCTTADLNFPSGNCDLDQGVNQGVKMWGAAAENIWLVFYDDSRANISKVKHIKDDVLIGNVESWNTLKYTCELYTMFCWLTWWSHWNVYNLYIPKFRIGRCQAFLYVWFLHVINLGLRRYSWPHPRQILQPIGATYKQFGLYDSCVDV